MWLYGHVLRRKKEVGIRRALEFKTEGVIGRGCPRLGWREQVEKDKVKAGLWDIGASGVNGNVEYLGFITSRQTTTPILGKMSSKC